MIFTSLEFNIESYFKTYELLRKYLHEELPVYICEEDQKAFESEDFIPDNIRVLSFDLAIRNSATPHSPCYYCIFVQYEYDYEHYDCMFTENSYPSLFKTVASLLSLHYSRPTSQ